MKWLNVLMRKRNLEDYTLYCDIYGAPFYEEREISRLCSTDAALYESKIDLKDMKAEER